MALPHRAASLFRSVDHRIYLVSPRDAPLAGFPRPTGRSSGHHDTSAHPRLAGHCGARAFGNRHRPCGRATGAGETGWQGPHRDYLHHGRAALLLPHHARRLVDGYAAVDRHQPDHVSIEINLATTHCYAIFSTVANSKPPLSYYAPYIFIKSVGFSQRLSSLMSGILSLEYYLATLIPIFIIDKVGRRPLLLFGLVGMCICMFILAGTTSVSAFGPGIAATVALFVYDFFFGVGWIPGAWLLTSEYAPLTTRSQTAALGTSATWIFTFLVAEITPVAITNIGYRTYIIFGVFNLAWIPIIYFFYPEVSFLEMKTLCPLAPPKMFDRFADLRRPARTDKGQVPRTDRFAIYRTQGFDRHF